MIRDRGQSTAEYSIAVAIFVAAAIGAQVYVKRGLMGRYHDLFESLGDPYIPGKTVADEHLIETGKITNLVQVDQIKAADGTPQQQTTVQFTSDLTTQERGGDTVTLKASDKLFQ